MNTRSVVGVIAGGVVDIAATNIFAIPVVVIALVKYHPVGSGGSTAFMRTLSADPSLSVTMMCLGGLASVLGGYTAALIARQNPLLVGALSAYLCVAFGVVGLAQDTTHTAALWQHVAGFFISPALGLLGGYLRSLQIRRVATA